jgi:uncharacterized membrane protein
MGFIRSQFSVTSRTRWYRPYFSLLFTSIVILGISLRWVNLEKKIYWHDEVYTSLRTTGHTIGELEGEMFVGKVINAKALLEYQQLDPKLGWKQALDSMAIEDPQHPPLYFVILRFWLQVFGTSITSIRSLSVWISLLLFPALYWLCLELFAAPAVGWMAVVLAAISPINLWLAQEAREYGLWLLTIILSSSALLRALRHQTKLSWLFYAVTLTLGYYSYLLTGLVAIGQGIYVFLLQKSCWNRTKRAFSIACGIGTLTIIPWLIIVVQNFETIKSSTGWLKNSLPLSITLQIWLLNASRLFLDFDLKLDNLWAYGLTLPIALLEIYSFYWLCRRTDAKIYLFILTLVGVTAVYTILPDMLFGGQRSVVTRYLMPCYLGIQLAVAYLLVDKMFSFRRTSRKLGQIMTSIVIVVGIASCTTNALALTWWHRDVSYHHRTIADLVNQKPRPLIISDAFGINPGNLISLSYLLEAKVYYLLLPEVSIYPRIPAIPKGFSHIFFLNLPDSFRRQFEVKHQGHIVPKIGDLWQYQPVKPRQTHLIEATP